MEKHVLATENLVFNDHIHYPDMKVPYGKATFVLGKNGSGKSTLFKLFNRTLTPSGGKILYEDVDVSGTSPTVLRKEVLLVGQSVYLFDLSIRENFDKFYSFAGKEPLKDVEIEEYLKLCSFPYPLDSDCKTLSGGERQRVYLAIYLSFLPNVLLLDEPTSALDEENSHAVIKNILKFCRKKSITPLIISHDSVVAEKYSENTVRI